MEMENSTVKNGIWLNSKDAKKILRLSDCHLMHMRLAGKLQFRKEGNRFFYLIPNQAEK